MAAGQPPYFGAAYYPEDWPLDQIDADIDLMKQAGMNCMRIGEFAWSRMEPEEGRYDFGWLDTVIDKLGAAGIATILGTPTCTPPSWLYQRYPECIAVRDDGVRLEHGARRHACPNSSAYRDHCRRIVTAMATEFGQDSNVVGWQIDNELYLVRGLEDHRGCFCDECVGKFRKFLQERFGTVEAINAAWGTDLWSQTYQSFEHIPPPRSGTWHHPSLLTAWSLFQADSYVDFADDQADILHRLASQPVGTDMTQCSDREPDARRWGDAVNLGKRSPKGVIGRVDRRFCPRFYGAGRRIEQDTLGCGGGGVIRAPEESSMAAGQGSNGKSRLTDLLRFVYLPLPVA